MAQSEGATYEPKVILLTGGAGFIGSNVTVDLVKKHPEVRVVVYDKLDYCATLNNLIEVWDAPNFSFVRGDICDADMIEYVIKAEKVDTIMNFAAQSHVDNSFGTSFEFTRSNVLGAHVIFEVAKENREQVRRVIHVSTDEVYGENKPGSDEPFHEASQLNPTNPYAASKACAEFMAKAYISSFKLPIIVTRGNNVYGRHQYPEKVIPKFISLMERDRKLTVHGSGGSRRSFIHVDDVSEAFEFVLFRGQTGEIYNIGTDEEQSVLDVARAVLKAYGRENEEDKWLDFVEDRHFNDQRYLVDLSSLADLGWRGPQIGFAEGLRRTIQWYRENTDHFPGVDSALVAHPRQGTAASETAPPKLAKKAE